MSVKKNSLLIILIFLSCIPLLDLLHPGLPITHDGQDHVARIANFYQNLTEGVLVPRWAANLNWGYGHPILMFLYPLPSYIASFFHFLGLSLIESVKIVFALGFIASGISMYAWIRNSLDEKSAFIAGLLYMFAPYRFVDLYVRGAMGEHVAFIFPPLVLYFLDKVSQKNNKWYILGGSFSFAAFVLSHNAVTLMFLPLFLLYAVYKLYFSFARKNQLLGTISIFLWGFLLSAFFWVPAFFEGKYTLRDIVTANSYGSSYSTIEQFFFGGWSYGGTGAFSVQVGIIHWTAIFASIYASLYLFKKNFPLKFITIAFFILFWASIFLMTKESNFLWERVSILQKFQFPWRFLTVSVFLSSALAGFVFYAIPARYKTFVLVALACLVLFINRNYWQANGFLLKEDSFFTSIYNGTTDTGESAPRWSVRFMEKRPKQQIEIIHGTARIVEKERSTTKHSYELDVKERTRIRENTLYFPGWNVYVNGEKAPVEFQDPLNRGLITFFVNPGKNLVEVKFEETKLRVFANLISLSTLVSLLIWSILKKEIRWLRFL